MKTRAILAAWLVVAVSALTARQASGAILFNTFGPGESYNIAGGLTIGGPETGEPDILDLDQGNQFVLSSLRSYRLDTVEAAIAHVHDAQGQPMGPDDLDVWLMSDNAGAPGSIIEEFHFSGLMGIFGEYNPPLVGTSVLHPLLEPGTPYWLIASAPDSETWAAWCDSQPVVIGLRAIRNGAGPWTVHSNEIMAAFRIQGTAIVPAPGALVLVGLGTGLVGWMRRYRTR